MKSFRGFFFDDIGVCINPDVIYQWSGDNGFYFSIAVAESDAGWTEGVEWRTPDKQGGHKCRFGVQGDQKRSSAIIFAAKHLKNVLSIEPHCEQAVAELDRIITEQSGGSAGYQYSIFDYL